MSQTLQISCNVSNSQHLKNQSALLNYVFVCVWFIVEIKLVKIEDLLNSDFSFIVPSRLFLSCRSSDIISCILNRVFKLRYLLFFSVLMFETCS